MEDLREALIIEIVRNDTDSRKSSLQSVEIETGVFIEKRKVRLQNRTEENTLPDIVDEWRGVET